MKSMTITPKQLAVASRRLRNGMTVLVHEDRKAPIVAMSLWYRVGSGHEPVGRHGFAHLFEHLMFSGSKHVPAGYFNAFAQSGAKDLNGTTWFDRTNYFITVPVTALERALWVESDRMGHLLSERSQAALDTQRGVISNEKMEGESRPYGTVGPLMSRLAYPEGHPYAHTTIGSMSDLADATIADVERWYALHYGAANATLTLAGDISAEEGFELVDRYFGNVRPGSRPEHPDPWIPIPIGDRRMVTEERVPSSFVSKQWNCPPWGHPDFPRLELAASILSSGAGSRLFDRLVVAEGLATEVVARISRLCVTSPLGISVRCRDASQAERVERIVQEEVDRLIAEGPTDAEVELAASTAMHGFSQSLEYVGGMSGQAAILAEGQCLRGDPSARWSDLEVIGRSTVADVRDALSQWLGRPSATMLMMPSGSVASTVLAPASSPAAWLHERASAPTPTTWAEGLASSAIEVDRSTGMPRAAVAPEPAFPAIEHARLASGATIHVAHRRDAPMVELAIVLPHGYADEPEDERGVHRMALATAMEGPVGLTAAEFQGRKRRLGVALWGGVAAHHATLGCSGPAASFGQAASMLMDIVQRPLLEDAALERYRKRWESGRRSTLDDAGRLVSAVLPALVFGGSSPYGRRGGGGPTSETIANLRSGQLAGALDRLCRLEEMAIFVCGDVTAADVAQLLGQRVVDGAVNLVPEAVATGSPNPGHRRVFVIDFPKATQVSIAGGIAMPKFDGQAAVEWRLLNDILGGSFEGRLNQNLRESKSWAYGAGSSIHDLQGASLLSVTASVQVDKGVDALVELEKELREIAGPRLPDETELERARQQRINAVGGRYETVGAVVSAMTGAYVDGESLDTLAEPVKRLRQVTLHCLQAAARTIDAGSAVWVVSGPAEVLLPAIRKQFGNDAEVIDAGNRL